MSYKAVEWALKVLGRADVPTTAKLVLVLLADHHNPHHGCFPSQQVLSQRSGLPERTVRRNVRVLAEAGLIVIRAWGRRNAYDLNFDWPDVNIFSPDTGHQWPQSPAFDEANTGHEWPQHTGHQWPLGDEKIGDTGHQWPLVLTSNPTLLLKSKLKVPEAGTGKILKSTGGEYEGEPNPEPHPMTEDPDVKVEQIIQTKMAPKTLPEIVNIYSQAEAKKLAITGGPLGRIWIALHALYVPTVKLTALSKEQMAQLRQAHDLVGNVEFVYALAQVIEHWSDFLTFLLETYGVKFSYIPSYPTISIVQKHVQPMMQFYQDVKPHKCDIVMPKVQKAALPLTKKKA